MKGQKSSSNSSGLFRSTKSIDYEEIKLKNICSRDTFPCYGCLDKPIERLSCEICQKRGFIWGNHPMVKFIDDFLSANLSIPRKASPPKAKDNDIGSSKRRVNFPNVEVPGSLLKGTLTKSSLHSSSMRSQSSNQSQKLSRSATSDKKVTMVVHHQHACDVCEMDPITGPRYHCLTCEDYDLCGKCSAETVHEHELERIDEALVPKGKLSLETSQILNFLLKSTVGKK